MNIIIKCELNTHTFALRKRCISLIMEQSTLSILNGFFLRKVSKAASSENQILFSSMNAIVTV